MKKRTHLRRMHRSFCISIRNRDDPVLYWIPLRRTVFVLVAGFLLSGCGQLDMERLTGSPFFLVGCVGIVAANAIWMAERVSLRRVIAGNFLLILVMLVALSLYGCSASSPMESSPKGRQSGHTRCWRLP